VEGVRTCWSQRIGKFVLLLVAMAAAPGIVPTGCRSAPQLTPQEAAGKHLYQVRCAHCHEDNDLGLKKIPPDLHGIFAHSTLPSGIPATDVTVRLNVLYGRGLMPGFAGRFDDEQMADLIAYLHTGLR
jgi:mono/diheme cytochrome c family protein